MNAKHAIVLCASVLALGVTAVPREARAEDDPNNASDWVRKVCNAAAGDINSEIKKLFNRCSGGWTKGSENLKLHTPCQLVDTGVVIKKRPCHTFTIADDNTKPYTVESENEIKVEVEIKGIKLEFRWRTKANCERTAGQKCVVTERDDVSGTTKIGKYVDRIAQIGASFSFETEAAITVKAGELPVVLAGGKLALKCVEKVEGEPYYTLGGPLEETCPKDGCGGATADAATATRTGDDPMATDMQSAAICVELPEGDSEDEPAPPPPSGDGGTTTTEDAATPRVDAMTVY
jgi:hypothetical protein